MENRISEVFETRRGKRRVTIDRFKFSEFRANKDSYTFRCTNRKCNITAKVSQNLKFVISIHGDHINHEAFQEETITKQKVMSVLKRKATTDLNAKPNKLIRQELRNCQDSGNLNHSDVHLFRKSMYEARRKLFPKVPKYFLEAKAMIYECKTVYFSKGEQFCFMESADSISIFTNASNLSLLNNAQHVFADGTFSYALKHFLQMYTVHVYINGFYLPIIYVFMETKSQQAYIDVWLKIKQLFLFFKINFHQNNINFNLF